MREIEFRAWDGNKKEMIQDAMALAILLRTTEVASETGKTHHFMQYTGLKDKNGKKIFEGDVLLIDYTEPLIGEVIYISDDHKQNPGFYLCREEGGFGQQAYHFSSQDNREVIGNLYENPELLAAQEETA